MFYRCLSSLVASLLVLYLELLYVQLGPFFLQSVHVSHVHRVAHSRYVRRSVVAEPESQPVLLAQVHDQRKT